MKWSRKKKVNFGSPGNLRTRQCPPKQPGHAIRHYTELYSRSRLSGAQVPARRGTFVILWFIHICIMCVCYTFNFWGEEKCKKITHSNRRARRSYVRSATLFVHVWRVWMCLLCSDTQHGGAQRHFSVSERRLWLVRCFRLIRSHCHHGITAVAVYLIQDKHTNQTKQNAI